MNGNYDVIIIGTGAGGGTLAPTLAPSGSGSCCWSAGTSCPGDGQRDPEPVFVTGRNISKDTWFDRDGKPFQPHIHYFVGGATTMYGAAPMRRATREHRSRSPCRGRDPLGHCAEKAVARAKQRGWTVVSMQNDFKMGFDL